MALPNLGQSRAYYTPPGSLVKGSRVPGYLPYPNPVTLGDLPVPNASSVDWPQAQFAQPFLPAGSSSTPPFHYPKFQESDVYGDAYSNPFTATVNLTGLLWLAGAGILGYYTAKKGWDRKVRAFVKSKL